MRRAGGVVSGLLIGDEWIGNGFVQIGWGCANGTAGHPGVADGERLRTASRPEPGEWPMYQLSGSGGRVEP